MARSIWQKTITNETGDIQNGVQITVNVQGGGLATIYDNQSGGTAKANPFLTGANGVAKFFAEPGFYEVTAFKNGETATFEWNNVGDNRLRNDLAEVGSSVQISGEPASDVASLRAQLAETGSGVEISGRTASEISENMDFNVDSLVNLFDVPFVDGKFYGNGGFYPDAVVGGGRWKAVASEPHANHNGGTVVTLEALQAWKDAAIAAGGVTKQNLIDNLDILLDWTGTGTGAFVRSDYDRVTIDMFGAVVDGSDFDNTIPLAASHKDFSTVYVARGTYVFKTPYYSGTHKQVIGLERQGRFNISVIFRLNQSDFGVKGVAFKPAGTASGSLVQSCAMENITFIGDLDVNLSDLSTIADEGVIAVDFAGVKDGSSLKGCHFRNLNQALITPNSGGQYTDTIDMTNVVIQRCRNAFDITTTVPVLADGLQVWDCYDWGYCRYISSGQVTFNNSNFSNEFCGLKGVSCDLGGVWFEGGNRQIQYRKPKIRSGYLSEAYADTGQKYHFFVNEDETYIDIGAVRLATNTRFFDDGPSVADPSSCTFRVKGAYNGGSFGPVSDYREYVRQGYQLDMDAPLCGTSRERSWVFSNIDKHSVFGLSSIDSSISGTQEFSFKKSGRKMLQGNSSFTITCEPEFSGFGSSYSRFEFVKIILIGGNNATPTGLTAYKELSIVKCGDDAWGVFDDGDTSDFSVAISNESITSVDVSVTINHSGDPSADVIFITDASENIVIDW